MYKIVCNGDYYDFPFDWKQEFFRQSDAQDMLYAIAFWIEVYHSLAVEIDTLSINTEIDRYEVIEV